MKILVGMPSKDSWGGPIVSEPPFVDALRRLGHEVKEEIYVFGDKEKPTPIYERFRRVISTANKFKKVLSNESFDIIHLNTAFDMRTLLRDTFSIWRMRPRAEKIFLKLHGSEADAFFKAGFLKRRLISFLKDNVDGFGVFTREEKENFLKLGFDEKKLFFCKNAISFSKDISNFPDRKHREPQETFQLLFVSRFIEKKGLIETIKAMQILKERGINFVLYCLGDGEMKAQAEALVSESGLGKKVQFTGYIAENEVERYFFDTDIFIFPTRHAEGFPIVMFKAIAAGQPLVTTRFRTAMDYLTENEHCIFCDSTPESIADQIEKLIGDKKLREEISNNNKAFGKNFSPENIAKEYVKIYEKILN